MLFSKIPNRLRCFTTDIGQKPYPETIETIDKICMKCYNKTIGTEAMEDIT